MRVRNVLYYPNGREPVEVCDDTGAADLARMIADYWTARGAQAPAFVFIHGSFTPGMRTARVDLRSNMKSGWPKGYAGAST